MKAEHNHWYKCQEGQMPEDFGIEFGTDVLIWINGKYFVGHRYINVGEGGLPMWYRYSGYRVSAWMLPSPYVEQ